MQLKMALEKYTKVKSRSTQPGTPDKALHEQLQEDCHSLIYMINEIDKSIDAAEKNPQRFKIGQAELSDRRRWVLSTKRKIEGIANNTLPLQQHTTTTTTNMNVAKDISPRNATTKLAAAIREENDSFIASEAETQQVLMNRQDRELDELSHHVVRIGELGRDMGQELDIQGQMLDDLSLEMDGTNTRLALAQKKIQHVLDKAGSRGQLFIIALLIIVLVVLIFLAIA